MDSNILLWQLRQRWRPLCSSVLLCAPLCSSGFVFPCSPQNNMFNLITNCCSWISEFQKPIRKVNVLVVGLDRAGKTSSIRGMLRVPSGDVGPTHGCVRTELRVDNFLVTLLDVGGAPDVRGTWRVLCGEVHAVILVVDSTDRQRIKEVKELLTELLKHPRVAGKPLLVLANKQDKMNALLGSEIIEILCLERLVNQSHSLCHIEPCSALMDMRKWTDRKTLRGLRWLLRAVNLDYPELCSRITKDIRDRRTHPPEERDRRGKTDKSRGKTKEEKMLVSKKAQRPQEKDPRPKTPSLQPITNILKKDSTLKKKLKKKKKKQVKINDTEEKSKGVKTDEEEEGRESGGKADRENSVQKEKACTPLISPKRGKLKSKVKVMEENPESVENEDESSKVSAAKKKKKKVPKVKKKNRINTEEVPAAGSQPVDLSATFDLYRKAILSLRERQDQGRLAEGDLPCQLPTHPDWQRETFPANYKPTQTLE
ncbi:hypothetical protein DPEC_G00029110 [Dallia pectoralis]|uniref:Uncharacterized protein n=1 Tax=Dallia pectoralis TaxID=75939 RepID=A0ACC2HIA6_DALPE|nr:hypothetical protein DPEC_G00029110 [Dallia pectoralis]